MPNALPVISSVLASWTETSATVALPMTTLLAGARELQRDRLVDADLEGIGRRGRGEREAEADRSEEDIWSWPSPRAQRLA